MRITRCIAVALSFVCAALNATSSAHAAVKSGPDLRGRWTVERVWNGAPQPIAQPISIVVTSGSTPVLLLNDGCRRSAYQLVPLDAARASVGSLMGSSDDLGWGLCSAEPTAEMVSRAIAMPQTVVSRRGMRLVVTTVSSEIIAGSRTATPSLPVSVRGTWSIVGGSSPSRPLARPGFGVTLSIGAWTLVVNDGCATGTAGAAMIGDRLFGPPIEIADTAECRPTFPDVGLLAASASHALTMRRDGADLVLRASGYTEVRLRKQALATPPRLEPTGDEPFVSIDAPGWRAKHPNGAPLLLGVRSVSRPRGEILGFGMRIHDGCRIHSGSLTRDPAGWIWSSDEASLDLGRPGCGGPGEPAQILADGAMSWTKGRVSLRGRASGMLVIEPLDRTVPAVSFVSTGGNPSMLRGSWPVAEQLPMPEEHARNGLGRPPGEVAFDDDWSVRAAVACNRTTVRLVIDGGRFVVVSALATTLVACREPSSRRDVDLGALGIGGTVEVDGATTLRLIGVSSRLTLSRS